MNDFNYKNIAGMVAAGARVGKTNATMACVLEWLERELTDTAPAVRFGNYLGTPIIDDIVPPVNEYLEHLRTVSPRMSQGASAEFIIQLTKRGIISSADAVKAMRLDIGKFNLGVLPVIENHEIAKYAPSSIYFMDSKNFQLDPDKATNFLWRNAKRDVIIGSDAPIEFKHPCDEYFSKATLDDWGGKPTEQAEEMKHSMITALYEQCESEEDSMLTLINTPAGENPAIAVADDCDRKVQIQRVNNGFVVQVGCQTIAFETSQHLCAAIKLFYKNPAKARKKYLHNPEM